MGLKKKARRAVSALALTAAAAGAVVSPFAGGNGSASLATINGCGLDGKEAHGSVHALENDLKNRFALPFASDIDPDVTLAAMMTANKPESLHENRAATIEGYITEVKPGGVESCNCGTSDPPFMDTHIYVAAKVTDDKPHSVIVEVTPRIRTLLKGRGIDWSTPALRNAFDQRHVRVTGWLFYDGEHENASENIKHRPHNWRATCWEVHPVTDIQVIP